MSNKLKDGLRELFTTTDPNSAAQDKTGAREANRPLAKERKEGDYLPVIAVMVGVGLLALAFLKPMPVENPVGPRLRENDPESSDSDW